MLTFIHIFIYDKHYQSIGETPELSLLDAQTMGNLIRQTGYKTPDAVPNGKVQQYE